MKKISQLMLIMSVLLFALTNSELQANDKKKGKGNGGNSQKVTKPNKPNKPQKPQGPGGHAGIQKPSQPKPPAPKPGLQKPSKPGKPGINKPNKPNKPTIHKPSKPQGQKPAKPSKPGLHKPGKPNKPHANKPNHWKNHSQHIHYHFHDHKLHYPTYVYKPIQPNYVFYVSHDYYYDVDYGYGTYPINDYMSVTTSNSLIRQNPSNNFAYSQACGSIPYGYDVWVEALVVTYNQSDWAMIRTADIGAFIFNNDCFYSEYLYVDMNDLDHYFN
jgi:hypothetical protein